MSPAERRIDGESRERLTILLNGLEQEKADNAEMRDVVIRASRRMGWLQWVIMGLACISIALGVVLAVTLVHLHHQGAEHRQEQTANIARNSKSIEIGCTLIKNLAGQAGVVGTGSDASPAARAQKVLVGLVFDVAKRSMRYHERYEFRKYYKVFLDSGPYVALPNCKQVARDPDSIPSLGRPR